MSEKNKRSMWRKRTATIVATFALLLMGAGCNGNNAVSSTITMEVNPGVEIKLNREDVVLEVNPLNSDGEIVVEKMDFEGADLDVTVNALIGSMMKNGYLNEISNSILISVEGELPEKNKELQKKLTEEVDLILKNYNLEGAVLSQTVNADTELQNIARDFGISVGKAQLMKQVAAQNTAYTYEDLAKLTINELNLLAEDSAETTDKVTASGTASSKAYIGEEEAKAIAFAHAGIEESSVLSLEVDFDLEKGSMVYELEIKTDEYKYDYDINAKTGDVVKVDKESRGTKGDAGDIIDDDYFDDMDDRYDD